MQNYSGGSKRKGQARFHVSRALKRRDTIKRSAAKTVEHFLISLGLAPNANLHVYLMTNDRRYLPAVADRLRIEAEKLGSFTGMMQVTPITADVALVREIITKRNAAAERLFRTAIDFHWSFFCTHSDDPADRLLMAMH